MPEQMGEKTEQPTPRRLEDAIKKGQIARSSEVQTVFVLMGALAAMAFAGREIWQQFVSVMVMTLGSFGDRRLDKGGARSSSKCSRARLYAYAASVRPAAVNCGLDGSSPTRR